MKFRFCNRNKEGNDAGLLLLIYLKGTLKEKLNIWSEFKIMKIPLKFLYIISILMIFAISSLGNAEKYPLSTWGEVKVKSHAFVFKLDLRQLVYRESLSLDEFVINDEITQLYFKVLNFPSNVSNISFSVTLTSPQGENILILTNIYRKKRCFLYRLFPECPTK